MDQKRDEARDSGRQYSKFKGKEQENRPTIEGGPCAGVIRISKCGAIPFERVGESRCRKARDRPSASEY